MIRRTARVALAVLLVVGAAAAGPVRSDAATVASVVRRCAPRVAPRTALAVISVESAGKWWAVGDNDRATPEFDGPESAIAYAERRVAEGGSIDIGLTQLNSSHLGEMGLSVRDAFEPCTNVAMGMGVLSQAWMSASARWGRTRQALFMAFEAYNGGEGSWQAGPKLRARVERYAASVFATAESFGAVDNGSVSSKPAKAARPTSSRTTASAVRVRSSGPRVFYKEVR